MLTIVVPIYNKENYIEKCVNSLVNQSYTNIEIILVDDGSTDNSGKICDELSGNFSSIIVIHKKNGGLVSAWKSGVLSARGEYIGFVDSDDYLENDYYEKLMIPFESGVCDISMCGFFMEGDISQLIPPVKGLKSGEYSSEKLEDIKHNYFAYDIQNSRCLKVYKKELILKNLVYVDESITLGEDMTITVPCVLDAKSIYLYEDYFGYHYRIYTQSMSHSLKPGQIENFFRLMRIVYWEFEEKGYFNQTIVDEFTRQLISVIGLVIFSNEKSKSKIMLLKKLRNNEDMLLNLLTNKSALKFSWRIIQLLFKYKLYFVLIFIGNIMIRIR